MGKEHTCIVSEKRTDRTDFRVNGTPCSDGQRCILSAVLLCGLTETIEPASSATGKPSYIIVSRTSSILMTPPADICGVIDQAAKFVAQQGQQFEQRMLREAAATSNSAKFAFLDPEHVFHPYYREAIERWLLHRFDQRNVTGDGGAIAEPPPPVHCEIIFAHLHHEEERANQLRICLETIYAAVETDHRFATLVAAQFQLHKLAALTDNFMSELVGKAGQWAARDPNASAWLFQLVWALNNQLRSIWSKIDEIKTLEQQVRLNLQSSWWIVLEE